MIVRPVADGVEVLAPAKLNLFLEVLGRRPDGYHEIETLMVAVDLFDTPDVPGRPIGADHPPVRRSRACRPGSENLVVRAAERLRDESGRRLGAHDRPAQGHPRGSGAGRRVERRGGDAGGPGSALGPADPPRTDWTPWPARSAATCRSSCRPRPPSAAAGASGSRPVALPEPLHFVLVCPPVGLSTAEVYRNVTPPDRPRPIGPVLEALARGETTALGRSLFNRLQPIAEALNPALVAGARRPGGPRPVARRVI